MAQARKIRVYKISSKPELVYKGEERRILEAERRKIPFGRRSITPSARGETTGKLFGRRRAIQKGRKLGPQDTGRTIKQEWLNELRQTAAANPQLQEVSKKFEAEYKGKKVFVTLTFDCRTGKFYLHSTRRSFDRRKRNDRRNSEGKITVDE